jgi:acyl-CoA thioesterase-1
MRMPPNYGPQYTEQFAALFGQVARAHRVPLVPFLLAAIAADDANFQADRIHPTAAVQPRLLDTVWPVLEPALKQRQKPAPTAKSAAMPGH